MMKKPSKNLARAALVLLLAVLSSMGAWAENRIIVVWMNDGSKTNVQFSDMPEFTYADGYVTLQTNSPSITLSWPIASVKELTFEDVATGIKATGLDIVSDRLDVYDLNGKLVKSHAKSVSEVPKGTYIVKDGSVSIKVVRK